MAQMQKNILLKAFLQGSANKNKGMTLLEVIVAMTVSLIVLSLVMSILASNRKLYAEDQKVTDVSQNLRIATDLVGIDIKKSGEGITEDNFPVVDLKQDANNNSELTLRLKVPDKNNPELELPLQPVCIPIDIDPTKNDNGTSSGTTTDPDGNSTYSNVQNISIARNPAPSEIAQCTTTDSDDAGTAHDNWEKWRDYRCRQDGTAGCQGNSNEKVRAFIHDGKGNGQFFIYDNEDCLDDSNVSKLTATPMCQGATNYTIRKVYNTTDPDGGYLKYDYGFSGIAPTVSRANSEIHLLVEQRKYSLSSQGVLQLKIDNEATQEIVDEMANFQIQASVISDGEDINPQLENTFPTLNLTTTTDLTDKYTWKNLRGIKFYLKAKDPLGNSTANTDYQRKLESTEIFLPRNTASCRFPC
jgi:prepilin-type N-terminal cleavage/methylation domain-containing protein